MIGAANARRNAAEFDPVLSGVSPEPVNEPESEPERTGAGPGSFTGINAT